MTQVIDRSGFVQDTWSGTLLPFEAFWTGQDIPETGVGVIFEADSDPFDLQPWFERLEIVVIPFGSSADGRGFSLARQLRQLGFTGRIRARGHLLVDQFRAALRVGIDELEISDEHAARMTEDQWTSVPLPQTSYQKMLNAA